MSKSRLKTITVDADVDLDEWTTEELVAEISSRSPDTGNVYEALHYALCADDKEKVFKIARELVHKMTGKIS